MNKSSLKLPVLVAALLCAPAAIADSLLEIWECELKDGKTPAELNAVTEKWLSAAKGMPGGKDLEVYLVVPVVPIDKDPVFRFVLVAPDVGVWGQFTKGYPDSAAETVDEEWEQVAECDENSLWFSVEIGAD